MSKQKKLQIRNSTAEFLIFTSQSGENSIEVRVEEETVWLTQKLIGVLFGKGRSTITEHLTNLFTSGELDKISVCRDFRHTADDGKEYLTNFYNLDAIIAVGFRVNSERAIQFRQWAARVLRDFAVRGYVLDKERLKTALFLIRNILTICAGGNPEGLRLRLSRNPKEHMKKPSSEMVVRTFLIGF